MASMEKRLSKEVTRMRAQLMSFSNDGANVSLNVPDTEEVRDVFSQVVTTVVQQQKQLTTLQTAMKQMSEDNAKSQEALIAWTVQCVNDLTAQNAATEERLRDAKQQLRTFAYNVQGFADEVDNTPPPPAAIEIRPPPVVRTKTPKIIVDPEEVGEGNGDTLFPTETGAPAEASLNVNENARWGGQVSGVSVVSSAGQRTTPHRKSEQQRAEAKAYYLSVKPVKKPQNAKERWRWAYRQVLKSNRAKALKIGFTRGKMPLQQTAAERLERIETELFTIPIKLKEFIGKETGKLYVKISEEVTKIESELEAQKLETLRLCSELQTNIDTVSDNLKQVDERLIALKEQVDNANKQADEMERKLDKVIARVGEHEICLFDSIRTRIQDLVGKIELMKGQASTTTDKLDKLAQEAQEAQEALEAAGEDGDKGQDEDEGRKLFEMLDYDTLLRSARIEINALDSNAFAVAEILRALRYELLSLSQLAGPEMSVEKEPVNAMLANCDEISTVLDTIFKSVQSSNKLWEGHDQLLASRWKVLSGVADAVKLVATISATLDDVKHTIETMPTTEIVNDIALTVSTEVSDKTVIKAVQPIEDKLFALTGQLDSVREQVEANASRASALPSDLDTQLEPLIQRIVEMHIGSGAGIKISRGHRINTNQQEEFVFTAAELEIAFASEDFDDEATSHILVEGAPVRVTSGPYMDRQGTIVAVMSNSPPGSPIPVDGRNNISENDTTEAETGDVIEAETADATENIVRYRVLLTPDSPLQTPHIPRGEIVDGLAPQFDDFPSQIDYAEDQQQHHRPPQSSSSSNVNISKLQQEMDHLAKKIEDLISGNFAPSSRAANASRGGGGGGVSNGGEIDATITAAISSSVQSVLEQLGDLRESSVNELVQAKADLKKAIITAIKKAIIEKDAEDKASFLTTKSMCVGCGRPSLVRKFDNGTPAVSLGFNPSLNSGSIAGPDVYRAGFKLPVSTKHSISSSQQDSQLHVGFTDDIFEEDHDLEKQNSISTYSEILAGMVGVTNAQDSGPAGIVLTISPCTSPVRQLSSTAKSIRHAQGKEESAMLRPIHRKGMSGKKSDKARMVYAPERFDLPYELSLGGSSSKIMSKSSPS